MSAKLRYLYRAYRYRFREDPAELRFLCGHLQCGQVALDIGCHKGAYTFWMRRCVGSSGAVYAFEPQPQQAEYLRSLFSTMRYDNVQLVHMAVSSTSGRRRLRVSSESGATHAATLESRTTEPNVRGIACGSFVDVETTTLDDFFAGKACAPHFLKIDVEGHEGAVLEGARETLEKHHPTLLLECEARHRPDGDVRPVFELLSAHGYEGSFFMNGQRLPLAEFNPVEHQRIEAGADRLPRNYVNNFAFTHPAG